VADVRHVHVIVSVHGLLADGTLGQLMLRFTRAAQARLRVGDDVWKQAETEQR